MCGGNFLQALAPRDRLVHNFAPGRRADLQHAFGEVCELEAHWLDDCALFRTLKARFGGASYLGWPANPVRREPAARRELAAQCERTRFAVPIVPPRRTLEGIRAALRACACSETCRSTSHLIRATWGLIRSCPGWKNTVGPLCRGRASGLFQRNGPALGQTRL